MAHRCPKCGKEMARHGNFWFCGEHTEPVFIPIEHPFSDLCASLPTPIAFVLDEFFRESNPFIALWRMVDAAEIITRFFTITVLSDILRQKGEFPQPVKIALTEKLERPTFGAWKDLLAIAIDNLPKEKGQTRCFVFELPSFVRGKWLPALGSGEDKPEEKLIALRNFIAHAGRLPDEKAQELLSAHRQRFESLVNELSFLSNYDLITCTKEGQIVWLKGLPNADGTFPKFERLLPFTPEAERVYLVHGDEWLDLFPLHTFTDILQWREELYDFERLEEVAPQIYFRLSERGYLECISFSTKAVFSHLGKDAYQRFRDIFRLEEWRAQRKSEAEAQGIQKLWDELVNELTEVFVGREEHVRQVKEAVKRKSKGFLWISGKPGIGKSALMAKLMKDYIGQTQHYIVIPYFFRFGQAGLSTMDFLATALKRLQVELKRTIEPAPNLPDRQQQLVEALEEAVSKTGKKVLFLVDGLDEIYRQEREFLNVPFMTVREGILWVCAGRSEGDLEEALKSRGAEWIFPDGLPPLDEQAVRAMLVEHLGRLKYALFERDEGQRNRFVEAVTRKSEGLPLYVRMVIEDLKAGQLTVWEEEKLPEGLVAYYERLLERMRVSDVGTVLTPLFCLLAWAKEPVTEGTMKFLLQTHHLARSPRWSELFRRALEHGHLMLQQRPTPDGEVGWTIYHDSFRQHLLESKTVSDNREWAQERWLEVCRDWKALASQEPSLHRYILRHYADHLHERWQMTDAQPQIPDAQHLYSALCQLALDTEFAQAQTEHLPNEPNLPLKTVQLALDAAIKSEDAPMMARLLMEHAKRAQIEEETPLQAWRKGHRERALKMATEIIFERDHKLGTLWCLLLAWVAESGGERDWAKRFLDEVRKRWEGAKLTELEIHPFDLLFMNWQGKMAVFLLGELGQVEGAMEVAGLVLGDYEKEGLTTNWAVKGFFEQAIKTAERIEDAEKRVKALREIAVEMAKVRMVEKAKEVFEQAIKTAERIEDAKKRAEELKGIAVEMAEVGIFEKAMKTAEKIEDAKERTWALIVIAEEMTKAGMIEKAREVFEQAMRTAERIEVVGERRLALREIMVEMAKAEMFEQAMETVERIESAWERSEALREIAVEMAKVGMVEKVMETLERIEDAEKQAKALREIVVGMAKAEMFEQAMETVERIESAWERTWALREIAVEMAKVGMVEKAKEVFEQAMETVERIEDAEKRALVLNEIVVGMAKVGMVEKAKEVFEQAMETVERIEDAEKRTWALRVIAEGMLKAWMFEQAMEAAERIEDAWWRTRALREITEEMTKAGMFEQAMEAAERIEDAWERSEALREIAVEMAKAGMVEQAMKIVERIEYAEERSGALREIAVGMAKVGMVEKAEEVFEQAMKTAERIEDAEERAWALREIAVEMAKVGMFEQAMEAAERIKDARKRTWALRVIAKGMLKAEMFEKAKEVFEQAMEIVEKIENAWERSGALREIAVGMARAGMFEQAMEATERIEDAWERSEALREIAVEMAKVRMFEKAREVFEQAMKTAERIESAWLRSEALRWIAEGMAKVGMVEKAEEVFEQAMKIAERIEDAWLRVGILREIDEEMVEVGVKEQAIKRSEALREIAVEMAKVGRFEQAMEAAERIEDAWWRTRALREITEEMTKAGMFEQAMEATERIESAWERSEALREIAEEMTKAGMFEQAMEAAERIEDAWWRTQALREIAVGMAEAGMVEKAEEVFEQAMKAAERIEDALWRSKVLGEIAVEMTKAGMFEQAMKIVERIEYAEERAWALIGIAEEMKKAGMVEKAKEVFEQAMKTAEKIENALVAVWALIAVGMAKAGMFEKAMEIAERIEDAWLRALALIGIAEEMKKAGMVEQAEEVFEQAMKTAEKIEDALYRVEALIKIAVEMAKVEMVEKAREVFEQAMKTAERIEDAWLRVLALRMVEKAKEVLEQAMETVERIENAKKRAEALSGIAEGMEKAGMFEQAMKTAEKIEDAWYRVKALIEIAVEMAKVEMFEKTKEVFEQAMETAEKIEDAKKRAEALKEIAEEMAKAGEVEGAVGIVERETGLRTEMLPFVLPILAERAREEDGKSKEGFLRLLPLCGWSLGLAYEACGLLAWLYPEQGEAIAKVVSGE